MLTSLFGDWDKQSQYRVSSVENTGGTQASNGAADDEHRGRGRSSTQDGADFKDGEEAHEGPLFSIPVNFFAVMLGSPPPLNSVKSTHLDIEVGVDLPAQWLECATRIMTSLGQLPGSTLELEHGSLSHEIRCSVPSNVVEGLKFAGYFRNCLGDRRLA